MQGFLHCVWPSRMPYSAAEKGEKKSRQAHRGSRQDGMPKSGAGSLNIDQDMVVVELSKAFKEPSTTSKVTHAPST